MTTAPEQLAANRSFGGWHRRFRHRSTVLGCDMVFAIYLPPQAEAGPVPVLYWLSGLTCTDENFMQKAGAQRLAAELGIAIVAPDTSPRGTGVPGDPDGAWDFGLGAGFYVNATEEPWRRHYRMYDYVVEELPALVEAHFPVSDARSISGHSMGGHGALVCALKNPGRYRSVSAFAPIANPSACPWGEKAFARYLGTDRTRWLEWDACALIAGACRAPAAAGGPGRGRRLPRRAAPPRGPARRLHRRRPPAAPAPAAGLRPQLLLHRQLHRRSPAPPRRRAARLKRRLRASRAPT